MIRIFYLLLPLLFFGCGGESESSQTQGWHFPGRDCQGCHNTDLASSHRLVLGGTLFKSGADAPDSGVCDGSHHMQLLDSSLAVIYDTRNDREETDGKLGSGNLFLLRSERPSISGDYYVRIISKNGVTLSQSSLLHSFTTGYDPDAPESVQNCYSCNACHSTSPKGGASGVLTTSVTTSCVKENYDD